MMIMKVVVERTTRISRVALVVLIAVTAVFIAAPLWCSRGQLSLLVEVFYFLALAQFWNLLAGYAGVISLGQQAFLGLGGYVLFFATIVLHWHPILALALAGVVGALVAIPGAVIVMRLRGAYLAIGTWVVAEILRLCFSEVTVLGSGSGISLPVSVARAVEMPGLHRDGVLYLLSLLLALLSIGVAYGLLCTRHGLALTSIRDNEMAARACGVNSFRVKLIVFVVAGLGTALTGAVIYLNKLRISPSAAFDINWTSYLIFIVIIGGIGTLEGPIVGTIVFFLLRQYLSDLGSWYLIILGGIAVLVMLKMPTGLWGEFSRRFDVSLFPTRRRLTLVSADSADGIVTEVPR
jgi:branched-chain amino acid transport system permease protein